MGWLGLQLGNRLKKEGFEVYGTVSSLEKKVHLEKEFPKLEVFQLNQIEKNNFKNAAFLIADFVFLTIPPSASDQYVAQMQHLVAKVIEANSKVKILYTSSSSVYGEDEREVNEVASINPQSSNAQKIVAVENFIRENLDENQVILRLAGLVGPNRHPVNYLIDRKNVKGQNKQVNLVHSEDIVNIVMKICKGEYPLGIYNICSPEHPTKSDYYTEFAKRINKNPPEFNKFDNDKGKVLICSRLEDLNYEFVFTSPYEFPIEA